MIKRGRDIIKLQPDLTQNSTLELSAVTLAAKDRALWKDMAFWRCQMMS